MLILRVISIEYTRTERGLGGLANKQSSEGLLWQRSGWNGGGAMFGLPTNNLLRYIGADKSGAAKRRADSDSAVSISHPPTLLPLLKTLARHLAGSS
jgi:hypothetical protein